jgi:hypothetical protein
MLSRSRTLIATISSTARTRCRAHHRRRLYDIQHVAMVILDQPANRCRNSGPRPRPSNTRTNPKSKLRIHHPSHSSPPRPGRLWSICSSRYSALACFTIRRSCICLELPAGDWTLLRCRCHLYRVACLELSPGRQGSSPSILDSSTNRLVSRPV